MPVSVSLKVGSLRNRSSSPTDKVADKKGQLERVDGEDDASTSITDDGMILACPSPQEFGAPRDPRSRNRLCNAHLVGEKLITDSIPRCPDKIKLGRDPTNHVGTA
jgi:hypothetical protein